MGKLRIALVEMKSVDPLNIYALVKMHRGVPLLSAELRLCGKKADCYIETIQGFSWRKLAQYDLIGFSIISCTAIPTYEMIMKLRKKGYKGTIVVGGPHATERAEESLGVGANFVCRHEGDGTLPELVVALENKRDTGTILGLSWMANGVFQETPDRPLLTEEELSNLPFPALDTIIGGKKMRQISWTTSRGCPYGCEFCGVETMFGKQYRYTTVEWRIAQFRALKENYPWFWHNCVIFVADDNLLGTAKGRKIALETLKRMIEEDLVPPKGWMCQMRVGDLTPEIARLLKWTNCVTVCLGIESTNPDILDAFHKEQTPRQIEEGLKCLQEVGINTLGMTIAGADMDTWPSFFKSIRQLQEWGLTLLQIVAMVPLPGTKMTKRLIESGRKFSLDYDLYNGTHIAIEPSHMSKLDAWKCLYLGSAWFYFCTPNGHRLFRKHPVAFCAMVAIVIKQGLLWPLQLLKRKKTPIWLE